MKKEKIADLKERLLQYKKFDNTWLGFVCGLVAPLFTLFLFYFIRYSHLSIGEFYEKVLVALNIVTAFVSLCLIANLLVFFLFIWTNRNLSARGVLIASFVYAVYVIYQKYIL